MVFSSQFHPAIPLWQCVRQYNGGETLSIDLIVRTETTHDHDVIHYITSLAFAAGSHLNGMEALIIRQLRKKGDLKLSFVAEGNGEIVGHIAFSPVAIGGRHDGWFGLGPVAVHPDMQRRGVGTALITHGLAKLQAVGANGCTLLGNPTFYRRFGFQSDGKLVFRSLPARLVQRLVFAGDAPAGELTYAPAFDLATP
jgi:putative acetyltransferase